MRKLLSLTEAIQDLLYGDFALIYIQVIVIASY